MSQLAAGLLQKLGPKLSSIMDQTARQQAIGLSGRMRQLGGGDNEVTGPRPQNEQNWMNAATSWDNIKAGAGAAKRFVANDSPFAAAGGALSGAGDALMSSGNPYAMAGGALLKFVGTLTEGIDKLRAWNNKLHDQNMQFAEFSASMAQVQYEQEARDFQLKRQQGDARSQTAREQAEAKSELDQRLGGIEDIWANFQNGFSTGASKELSRWLKSIGIEGHVNNNADLVPGVGEATSPHKFLADLGWEDERLKDGRPQRLR